MKKLKLLALTPLLSIVTTHADELDALRNGTTELINMIRILDGIFLGLAIVVLGFGSKFAFLDDKSIQMLKKAAKVVFIGSVVVMVGATIATTAISKFS